jgi:hypothetical protein
LFEKFLEDFDYFLKGWEEKNRSLSTRFQLFRLFRGFIDRDPFIYDKSSRKRCFPDDWRDKTLEAVLKPKRLSMIQKFIHFLLLHRSQ